MAAGRLTVARSTYIWTVVQGGVVHPVAVFTVKHELATWWAGVHPDRRPYLMVWRHRDATPAADPVDVTEEMET